MSVYGKDETVLGHHDISKSAQGQDWSGLALCPSRSADEVEKYFAFTGTPGLLFAVEMGQDQEVKLDEPKPVEIDQWNPVHVFQFIPPQDISKTQLDVTVKSNSDVPAYLKVSRVCKDVKENIRVADYKGESIRLSFAKKGRITLSTVSIPALNDSTSSWFIGIAMKSETGKTATDARKTVILTLTRSFDYSYAEPICLLVFLPAFIGGLIVAVWASKCFKEPYVNYDSCVPNSSSTNGSQTQLIVSNTNDVSCKEIFEAMMPVILCYWFGGGPKTYSYITSIVGWVLMVGAFQFVFADWYVMIHEGDRDNCYYNDFCYRVWQSDIPFNLMISNLAYIIHAAILAGSVLWMEGELLARCKKIAEGAPPKGNNSENFESLPNHLLKCPNITSHLAEMSVPKQKINKKDRTDAQKRKFSLSIGYAFAWALFFEGSFSALYHLCPSKMTFQFDTAFMFVIAGLIVILLYNGIEFM